MGDAMSPLMKGHTFAKGKHKMTYPAIAEIKVDEIRCDVQIDGSGEVAFLSFAGKPLFNLDHFAEKFRQTSLAVLDKYGMDITRFDCGVLVNKNFNDTYRYVRSKTLKPEMANWEVEFILFDLPQSRARFSYRCEERESVVQQMVARGLNASEPNAIYMACEADVMPAYEWAKDRGFEGLMLKSLDHVYEGGKRTYGWLKVKPENEADARITAVNRANSMEGVPLDRAGSVSVECEDGSTADVGGFTHDLGRLMLAHPEQFIGQWMTFTYMERDRQGGYRHPRFERLREEKA